MENIYEQLYDVFALPQMAVTRSEQNQFMEELAAALSPDNRLPLLDIISTLRMQWGMEAFSIGLRLGLELITPYNSSSCYQILRDFLSKFDQPVT